MLSKSLGEVDWRRHFPPEIIKMDKGIPVLEPQEKQFFPEEGTMFVTIGELLIQHKLLNSKKEVKERHGKMLVKIVPERGTGSFPMFATRDLLSKFELWHGDQIVLSETRTATL